MTATEPHPVLRGSPYRAYVYAYPHKTAYRSFAPRALRDVWAGDPRDALFLYVHVPFCTMRCGFCNLFTTANPKPDLVTFYLDALRRQAEAVREALPDARFTQMAIGGGTPTYLSESELAELFDIVASVTGAGADATPAGVEVSPDTLTPGKVALLGARGVDRVSIGVQSFIEAEAANSGRPQSRTDVDAALTLLAGAGFGTVNIDLIYGLPGQTVETWLYSLRAALRYEPEELYLYPLYVRPLTALGQSHKEWDDTRLACYREARDVLLAAGYEQVSMRMFRTRNAERGTRSENPESARNAERGTRSESREPASFIPRSAFRAPPLRYCCQDDGMVGLGCGARSYTRSLHYALDYAVRPKSVKGIIADYLARTRAELATADHGFALDDGERRRRYLLQSVLNVEGLDVARYVARFGCDPAADFPDLHVFEEAGLVVLERVPREGTTHRTWRPTPLGLERSDALGPWFISDRVRTLMAGYEAK
ncbi:STM4012 family radical SAM protein [Frigoriglobus tundricola]|uniref:Coproporphyrinogen III oxidase family protein n=1 Tax=Frigoriglobus tundricola TaxID=2774151 RepID=A0A6M5YSY9_9BACT|nr:STM4012 family radical SAM protein [Frigoriglobus tundricola]QJW96554.1 Coproporphyrinogen III oxidase family protein [Frigoriglobus tundricola]